MSWSSPDPNSKLSIVRHCALHTLVSAAPSFTMAYIFGWNRPSQVLGMFAGIALFLASAALVHISRPFIVVMSGAYSSRAMRFAKTIRLVHAVLLLPSFLLPVLAVLTMPDVWAGMAANLATEMIGYSQPIASSISNLQSGEIPDLPAAECFVQACLATFIEGWILAIGLALLAMLVWLLMRLFVYLRPIQLSS